MPGAETESDMSDFVEYKPAAAASTKAAAESDADSAIKELDSAPKTTFGGGTAEQKAAMNTQIDSSIQADLKLETLPQADMDALLIRFNEVQKKHGKEGELPANQIMNVIRQANVEWEKKEEERLLSFIRFDENAAIDYNQMIRIMNRCTNEKAGGLFMTVRELHGMYRKADTDNSGKLNVQEIVQLLRSANMMISEQKVKDYMDANDTNDDGLMDFEEFTTLAKHLYKKAGGKMVANKRKGKFGKTRQTVDNLMERVDRNNLTIDHLKQRLAQMEMQAQTVSTVEQTSQVTVELEGARKEMKQLQIRKTAMEKQHKDNVSNVKRLGNKEKQALKAKVAEIDKTDKTLRVHLDFVDKEYTQDFKDTLVHADQVEEQLKEVLEFANSSIRNCEEDQVRCQKQARELKDMLKRYKMARKGTVYDPNLFNSAKKIHEYLQEKTALLADWLLQRTKFTQADRERFLARVEEARKKRAEYEANLVELGKHMGEVGKKVKKNKKELVALTAENEKLRAVLNSPQDKINDEALCKKLMDQIKGHEAKIAEGQAKRFEIARKVFAEEHLMHIERAKTSLLQVELGELSLLLQDVEHDPMVEERWKKQQAEEKKKGTKKKKKKAN